MHDGQKIRKSLFLGLFSEFVTIVLGIIVPRLTLTSFGSEINGLVNSVTQIYTYIALLEAGIGLATVQALYKPVKLDNKEEINGILAATNRYYHRTGFWYLIAILIFSVVYPVVVQSDIPKPTVVGVIVLNGLGSVVNYFVQAKYYLLLQAEGKNYIKTSLNMFVNIFKNIAKIILMYAGLDVLWVQSVAFCVSLIQMAYIYCYIHKYYSWIDLKVKPNVEAISQSKHVMVHQVGGLIFNNTDTIILSVFCGLKIVSVYSMYAMLFSMIRTALDTVATSFSFKLGQMYNTGDKRFGDYFDAYEMLYMALVFSLYCVAYIFILPFMKLYTRGISDINYIDPLLPVLFIAVFLLTCSRSPCNTLINVAGHFKETQGRSIIEAVINLSVTIIAVRKYGIYGALIGTIVALAYRANDIILYTNKKILQRSCWKTYKKWLINLLAFLVLVKGFEFVNLKVESYFDILLHCALVSVVTIAFYILIALIVARSVRELLMETFKKDIHK